MKKMKNLILLAIVSCVISTSTVTASTTNLQICNNTKIVSQNLPLVLPEGIYILCCVDGHLQLMNLLGQIVALGTSCGDDPELLNCIKICIDKNGSACPQCPYAPQKIIDDLNSMEPSSGRYEEQLDPDNMPCYNVSSDDITWW
jgi:hypothetical protein